MGEQPPSCLWWLGSLAKSSGVPTVFEPTNTVNSTERGDYEQVLPFITPLRYGGFSLPSIPPNKASQRNVLLGSPPFMAVVVFL